MAAPRYAERFARLPAVLQELSAHPAGLPLVELAERFDVPPEELREDLFAYYTADVGTLLLGLNRPDVLEFLGPDGDDADPDVAEVVRVVDETGPDELGAEHLEAPELALIYAAARALLDLEPEDHALAGALDLLAETLLGEPTGDEAPSRSEPLPLLRRAVEQRHRARIVYSRAWSVGVAPRVIEPYRLVQTRRGWEVDAGPPDDHGRLRTFLLSHVRACEILDETFDEPVDLDQLLAKQRRTTSVRVQIPHAARWAADFYAEHVDVVEEDEETTTLDLALLPPVEDRVALLTLAAGQDARILEPAALIAAGPTLAAELLAHHRALGRA